MPTAVESLFTEGLLSSFLSHTDSIGNKTEAVVNPPPDVALPHTVRMFIARQVALQQSLFPLNILTLRYKTSLTKNNYPICLDFNWKLRYATKAVVCPIYCLFSVSSKNAEYH